MITTEDIKTFHKECCSLNDNYQISLSLKVLRLWLKGCDTKKQCEELREVVRTLATQLRNDSKLIAADNFEDLLTKISQRSESLIETTLKRPPE